MEDQHWVLISSAFSQLRLLFVRPFSIMQPRVSALNNSIDTYLDEVHQQDRYSDDMEEPLQPPTPGLTYSADGGHRNTSASLRAEKASNSAMAASAVSAGPVTRSSSTSSSMGTAASLQAVVRRSPSASSAMATFASLQAQFLLQEVHAMRPHIAVVEQVPPLPIQASLPTVDTSVHPSATESVENHADHGGRLRHRLVCRERMQAACDKRSEIVARRQGGEPGTKFQRTQERRARRRPVPGTRGRASYINSDSDPRTSSSDERAMLPISEMQVLNTQDTPVDTGEDTQQW